MEMNLLITETIYLDYVSFPILIYQQYMKTRNTCRQGSPSLSESPCLYQVMYRHCIVTLWPDALHSQLLSLRVTKYCRQHHRSWSRAKVNKTNPRFLDGYLKVREWFSDKVLQFDKRFDNMWEGWKSLEFHWAQSGLSQHLLDAHRMARCGGGEVVILRHRAYKHERQSDNDSTYPLPTAELASWPHRSWGENGRGKMMRGDGKTLPTTITLQQLWHHLYLSPATHPTEASQCLLYCEQFFSRVVIFSFPNICFFNILDTRTTWGIKPYNIHHTKLTIHIRIISSSIHDQEIIK